MNLWVLDLALTAVSFLLAYYTRNLFDVEGHTLMEFGVYLWILAIILPTWAILLPVSGVIPSPRNRFGSPRAALEGDRFCLARHGCGSFFCSSR